jgi:hypothetical protein
MDVIGLFKIGPGRKGLGSRPMSLITCDYGYWTVASNELRISGFQVRHAGGQPKVVNNPFMTGNDADARFTCPGHRSL